MKLAVPTENEKNHWRGGVINNPKSLTDSTGENLFGDILDGLKGIGDSLVDNLIIEPLKVGAKVWDYVAEMVTGKPSYVANSISKIQEKVEESRSENVNNEKWYYGGWNCCNG